MKKLYIFFISLFFINPFSIKAENFNISAKNAILYNITDNEVLYEKKSNEKVSIASLTKIMTSIVALEKINNINDYVTITSKDFEGTNGYSKAGFKIGDKVTYEDLLYGVLLPSGAEAVNAIVSNTYGYDEFINKMNEMAKKIGLTNTSFSNAIGKDDELNYSTIENLSKLLEYALKNKTFKKIFTSREYTTSNNVKLKSTLIKYAEENQNISLISGAKSGFTKEAGRCLASLYNQESPEIILIVVNSDANTQTSAINDTLEIYNYLNNYYSNQIVIDDNKKIITIPVKYSKEKSYTITGTNKITKYLKNDSNITYSFDGVKEIKYNTQKGTKLGTVSIYNNEKYIASQEVFLEENIKYYPLKEIITTIIIIIIFIIIIIVIKRRRKHD